MNNSGLLDFLEVYNFDKLWNSLQEKARLLTKTELVDLFSPDPGVDAVEASVLQE